MSSIFLSYRKTDSATISGILYERLADYFGPELVFKDIDTIPLGENFKDYISNVIQTCQIVLSVVGPDWLNATDGNGNRRLDNSEDFVRLELEIALQRKIRIIPVFIRNVKPLAELELPPSISQFVYQQGIFLRHGDDFNRDVQRLIESVSDYLAPKSQTVQIPSQIHKNISNLSGHLDVLSVQTALDELVNQDKGNVYNFITSLKNSISQKYHSLSVSRTSWGGKIHNRWIGFYIERKSDGVKMAWCGFFIQNSQPTYWLKFNPSTIPSDIVDELSLRLDYNNEFNAIWQPCEVLSGPWERNELYERGCYYILDKL